MSRTPSVGKLKRFLPGDLLTQENEISRKLFIIKRGQVSVFKTHMGQKVVLSTMSDGEIFGELSFIEASPRSASVEALTIVDVQVIDGEDVMAQVQKLPDWVLPIFKTVFARLRAADQRTVTLHGLSGFERKHFGKDSLTQKAYRELLRANRLLKLAYAEALHSGRPGLKAEEIPTLFNEVLIDLALNIPLLMKVLKDQGFISRDEMEKSQRIVIDTQRHDAWIRDLQNEVSMGRYLRLSDSGFGVLRELLKFIQNNANIDTNSEQSVEASLAEVGWSFISFGDEAISELKRFNIVKAEEPGRLSFIPAAVNRICSNQVILRFFTPEQRTKAG